MRLVTVLLTCAALMLLAVGLVMLYSAETTASSASFLVKQTVAAALGLALAAGAATLEARTLRRAAPWLLLAAAVLLVLVLIPGIGYKANGARRWLRLAGWQFQPSDFAKLAFVIALAAYGHRYQRDMPRFLYGIVFPGLGATVLIGLIVFETDVGTALLLAAIAYAMLLVAGARLRYLVPLLLVAMLAFGGLLIYVKREYAGAETRARKNFRFARLYSWMELEETRLDLGYQVYAGRTALGAGGLTGFGLGNGTQKHGFLPEHRTDFIFPILGQELGFVGTVSVTALYVVVLLCGATIAQRARDRFGFLLAAGVTFLLIFQAAVNLGVVTGLLPNKGLSLPFISYGGSNLVFMLAGIGLLVGVERRTAVAELEDRYPGNFQQLQLTQLY